MPQLLRKSLSIRFSLCVLFAHFLDRSIGVGEVQLGIRIAEQCDGEILPWPARDFALRTI